MASSSRGFTRSPPYLDEGMDVYRGDGGVRLGRGFLTGRARKWAFTILAASIVTAQVEAFEGLQFPLQPAKMDPVATAAVRFTTASLSKLPEQVDPHTICEGLLVTRPAPVPALVMVSMAEVGAVNARRLPSGEIAAE